MLSAHPRVFLGSFPGFPCLSQALSFPLQFCPARSGRSQSVVLGAASAVPAASPCVRLGALRPVPFHLMVRAGLSLVRLWIELWTLNISREEILAWVLQGPELRSQKAPALSLGLTPGRTCYSAVLSSVSLSLLRMHCLSAFLLPNSLFVQWQLLCHFFFFAWSYWQS